MRRLVPVLIVATVLALGATVAADHPAAPIPAAATTETKVGPDGMTASQVGPDVEKTSHASRERGAAGDTAPTSGPAPSRETPRQKAHRIIAATWPKSQVANAMRVVRCESGFNQWALNPDDKHSDGSRGSYGWFQVGAIWRHDPEVKENVNRLYLPWTNARVALRIWKRQGWWAWRNCAMRAGLL